MRELAELLESFPQYLIVPAGTASSWTGVSDTGVLFRSVAVEPGSSLINFDAEVSPRSIASKHSGAWRATRATRSTVEAETLSFSAFAFVTPPEAVT